MQHPAAELMAVMLVGAVFITPSPKSFGEPVHSDYDRPPIVVNADDPMDMLIVWQAVARYRSAGLDLPAVEITVHDRAEPCDGNRGRFTTRDGYRIAICARHANPRVEMRWRLRTAVHELAHAYISSGFTDQDINGFLDMNELKKWIDFKTRWEELGAEVAAESLTVGVLDTTPDIRIEASCDELLDNYVFITRTQPDPEAFENCR